MGAPYNEVMRKAEDAIYNLVLARCGLNLSAFNAANIFRGLQGTELATPRIEIICESAKPELSAELDIFTGNWHCAITIALITNYGDHTRAQREAMAAELFDIVLVDDLADALNNIVSVPDFTVFGGGSGKGETFTPDEVRSMVEEHEYKQELSGQLYCRPSTSEVQR